MTDAEQAQVARCDDLAAELDAGIAGDHLLDALGQLGLQVDDGGEWPHETEGDQPGRISRLVELLPELAEIGVGDVLADLGLVLVPGSAAGAAWLALLDQRSDNGGP
jgi:hypothetical protein